MISLQEWTTEEIRTATKRAQDVHEELNLRLERRINEITEMQRLAEDRFRQERVSFKADEAKRFVRAGMQRQRASRALRA